MDAHIRLGCVDSSRRDIVEIEHNFLQARRYLQLDLAHMAYNTMSPLILD